MESQIIENFVNGNKKDAFRLFDDLSQSRQLRFIKDMASGANAPLLIKMLNSFEIRAENKPVEK